MKYISICSGIEGATVAFHPLGWTPLAVSEIDAFPSAVLAHHYPQVPNLGDMTKFHDWPEELLAECDMLVGGPPCQAFSIAGMRNSLDDDRGNLTLTYVKLIDHIDSIRRKHGRDPIIALYENVPGIYSTRDNAFGCLVGAICGQDAPIETETGKWPTTGVFWGQKRRVGYRTLDAQFFGLAQRRRRCFLLAVPNELVERLGDKADPAEILSIAESLRGDSPPSREAGPCVAALTANGVGTCGADDNQGQAGHLIPSTGATSHCLNAGGMGRQDYETETLVACREPYTLAVRGRAGEPTLEYRSDGTANAILTPNGGRAGIGVGAIAFTCKDYGADAGATSPTLRAMGHDGSHANAGGQVAVAIPIQEVGKRTGVSTNDPRAGVGIGAEGDPMFTLQAGANHGVAFAQNTRDELRYIGGDGSIVGALGAETGMKQQSYIQQTMAVRRITVVEAERLQGFEDGYTDVPYRGKQAADGPRYKAIGNSFATKVVFWIGFRIQKAVEQQFVPSLPA